MGRVGLGCQSKETVISGADTGSGKLCIRLCAQRMAGLGLIGMMAAALTLSILPMIFGIIGYIVPIIILSASYAQFQTANNTAIMTATSPDQRGAIIGMLNLSRNQGLITGASVMGAIFAFASATTDITTAPPRLLPAVCASPSQLRRLYSSSRWPLLRARATKLRAIGYLLNNWRINLVFIDLRHHLWRRDR